MAPPRKLHIGGVDIRPGEIHDITVSLAYLYDRTPLAMPVKVFRGREDGPVLFVSAAIHGDEINGVEIIHRLINHSALRSLRGTLVTVPIVNVYGFNARNRYLPDRRDLNRSFPGSATGSLASQVAHQFVNEIVSKCTHGIDLHTAAIHRENLPQVRACVDDGAVKKLARAFGTPVVLNSNLRDGSLRQAAVELNVKMLLFEGGEALRFNENAIRTGLRGVMSVMAEIGMLDARYKLPRGRAQIAKASVWIRAPMSGILRMQKQLGDRVAKGEVIGIISDPYGRDLSEVRASRTGVVIGRANLPLAFRGEALFHIAVFDKLDGIEDPFETRDSDFDETGETLG